ncbi:hypothetical protein UR09_06715 [Candidatus Nitromaritima sp. SCGC AAA799-A02]|nr:hypothetical protein UR09_06715 [Candidatus Nitromaritima sp. SCGC AAA799-A02]
MQKKTHSIKKYSYTLLAIFISGLMFLPNEAIALSDADKAAIGTEITTLYRAARGVIAKNQGLINDASKGDKGLSADAVIAATKENYKKATGKDFAMADKSTLMGETQAALLGAIKQVMDDAQPLINEKGKGLKGFLPAIEL